MNGGSLSRDGAREAMESILAGMPSTPQIAAFLAALRTKGESVEELHGFVEALRESAIHVDHGLGKRPVLDTCGTGGDALGTINVSTLAAIVIAACGVPVAKHGNRSISSKCGCADLLEALGIVILTDADLIAASIREVGIGFLFAPALHPALKHAMPARKELGTRTVFNVLGPLVNPAKANRQLVGAPSLKGAEMMSEVLARLGLEHGLGGPRRRRTRRDLDQRADTRLRSEAGQCWPSHADAGRVRIEAGAALGPVGRRRGNESRHRAIDPGWKARAHDRFRAHQCSGRLVHLRRGGQLDGGQGTGRKRTGCRRAQTARR